jgi:uncharacterized protein YaaQ
MKLVIVVIQDQDAVRLLDALMEKGYSATKLASTGGFLREGNTTLLIGTEDKKVGDVLSIIRAKCKKREQFTTPLMTMDKSMTNYIPHPVKVPVGGGTVFVVDVERFEKI